MMRVHHFVFLFILIVFSFLGLYGIEWGLPYKNLALTTYHPDESEYLLVLSKMSPRKFDFNSRNLYGEGTLYVYLLGAAEKVANILGLVRIGTREFYTNNLQETSKLYLVGRFLSLAFGLGGILAIYFLCKALYGRRTGLIGASLMAILPIYVITSHYQKMDIILPFFISLTMLFSARILREPQMKWYVLSAIFAALATGTKYNGGIALFAIFAAHIVSKIQKQKKFSITALLDKKLLSSVTVFVIVFFTFPPFTIIYFKTFLHQFRALLSGFAQSPAVWNIGIRSGWQLYLFDLFPYGFGLTVTLAFFLGLVYLLKERKPEDIHILVFFLLAFFVMTRPKTQSMVYLLPIVPAVVVICARLLGKCVFLVGKPGIATRSLCLLALLLVYLPTLVYTCANLRILMGKDVREEVSEWIEKNIPKTATIGIVKSYFWTPSVIRQYNPPYRVIMGGDNLLSQTWEAIRGLKTKSNEMDYLVLSNFEYKDYLRLPEYFPIESKILAKVMTEEFQEIIRFEKQPEFLGMRFKNLNHPPYDLIPNPTIVVYKRKQI